MQITPINNNQTNFRGDIFLRGARKITQYGKKDKAILSLAAEHIESISSITPKKAGEYNKALSPEVRDKLIKEDSKFKTLVTMVTGAKYEVPYNTEDVIGAKKMVWGTSKVTEPVGTSVFLFD